MIPDRASIRAAANEAASEVAGRKVREGQPLVTSGLLDSLSVLKLISLLEKKLKIFIPPQTLQPEDFDDVDLIVATIERVAREAP